MPDRPNQTWSEQISPVRIPGCRIEGVIAEGGMAVVYAAVQEGLERPVAVKIMKEGDAALIQRFLQEARMLAAINHRHVVTIHDVGVLKDGRPYLTMERLMGGDLRTQIKAGISESNIRIWTLQLIEALRIIHAEGIVHRDIKPANILFRDDESLVLSDFGIAKRHDINLELTQTGTVVGSPAYSSPEQVMAMAVDTRSDQYSLGVVLVEMLLGKNPFRAEQYAATLINHVQMSVPGLPQEKQHWQPVVDRLLAKSPEQRFAGMQEVATAVAALSPSAQPEDPTLVGTPMRTEAVSRTYFWNTWSLHGGQRWLGIAGLLLLAVLTVMGLEQGYRTVQIRHWLTLAQERSQSGFLMTPVGDSALDWYRRVLRVVPANPDALNGIYGLEREFLQLAVRAESKHDWNLAHQLLDKAFAIRPGDPVLSRWYQDLRHKKENWERSQLRSIQVHPTVKHASYSHKRRSSKAHSIKRFWHHLFGH